MKGELLSYVESRVQGGLEINKTVDLIRRYAFIEQSCIRALAGWFLKEPDWEAKIRLGYYLFAHTERVYELSGRLEELRGGNRNANIEPVLDRIGEELVHARDGDSFLSGLSLILRRVEEAYREHLDAADASAMPWRFGSYGGLWWMSRRKSRISGSSGTIPNLKTVKR